VEAALGSMQVPLIAKHPADRSKPLSAVEVAPDVICRDPPVIVIPSLEMRPPNVEPPVKVEVPVSVARIVPPDTSRPEVEKSPADERPP